jgi:hypothetical protein
MNAVVNLEKDVQRVVFVLAVGVERRVRLRSRSSLNNLTGSWRELSDM